MGDVFLQVFLLITGIAIGALAAVGVRHALAHFRPVEEPKKSRVPEVRLTPEIRERLLKEAESHFQIVVNANATQLARELKEMTRATITDFDKISQGALADQSDAYKRSLTDIKALDDSVLEHTRALAEDTGTQADSGSREFLDRLNTELAETAEARKAQVVADIDGKLNDAVVSFLVETLGHDVDLGSQMKYILARLDENKDAFKAEVRG